ncbi:MAG: glycoside hydrolase family 28 protein [Bacteroidia bacterium]|nr:glycoside hydrolase family 28 protein [Bacteroidia bacterium]
MKNKILHFTLMGIFIFLSINGSFGVEKKKVTVQTPLKAGTVNNVLDFGAKGDGKTLDSPSINRAIEEAAAKGGGTVYFPAGTYLSVSIRLKSNISLYIDQGATILAASTSDGFKYDPAEPNVWGDSLQYQDFGHSHWHNSLIWGENLENISIMGPGVIWGKGLVRGASNAPEGSGNKAIALKWCRNVIFRDFSILMGGWFGILATGVDNLTIDNLKIDTNRDGMDIDCCLNVRISNCSVNSPRDDGICLKSSFGLGIPRATENVTITNCQVSGFTEGSLLDGTYKRNEQAAGGNGPTGRIKFGTESNGGFKNITISNCVFTFCRGLALEAVDGALLEDITITNITMRDIVNAPIFLRLGERMRGPADAPGGELRRIIISDITVYNADPRSGCIISGDPGHDIKDVRLSNIRIYYKGGGTKEQAEREVPGFEKEYPEPYRFGTLPSYGFFIRHADGVQLDNIEVSFMENDMRPAFFLDDVKNADFMFVKAKKAEGIPSISLKNVTNLNIFRSLNLADRKIDKAENEKL